MVITTIATLVFALPGARDCLSKLVSASDHGEEEQRHVALTSWPQRLT
jgi:hypothetical protein